MVGEAAEKRESCGGRHDEFYFQFFFFFRRAGVLDLRPLVDVLCPKAFLNLATTLAQRVPFSFCSPSNGRGRRVLGDPPPSAEEKTQERATTKEEQQRRLVCLHQTAKSPNCDTGLLLALWLLLWYKGHRGDAPSCTPGQCLETHPD